MVSGEWLRPDLILPAVDVDGFEGLVSSVAAAIAGSVGPSHLEGLAAGDLEGIVNDALCEGESLGCGAVLARVVHPRLHGMPVAMAIATRALRRPGKAAGDPAEDLFFFHLAEHADPVAPFLLRSHLGRLIQSDVLLAGLRSAERAGEVLSLVRVAESSSLSAGPGAALGASGPLGGMLAMVVIRGELPVDALLVTLLDQGFAAGCVVEAQSVHEAVTREVPLFAGFQDIFGDPGGVRLILVEVAGERMEGFIALIQNLCEEFKLTDARVLGLPVSLRWEAGQRAGRATEPG